MSLIGLRNKITVNGYEIYMNWILYYRDQLMIAVLFSLFFAVGFYCSLFPKELQTDQQQE
jgi:hypothetical protein